MSVLERARALLLAGKSGEPTVAQIDERLAELGTVRAKVAAEVTECDAERAALNDEAKSLALAAFKGDASAVQRLDQIDARLEALRAELLRVMAADESAATHAVDLQQQRGVAE